ncbi:MAG: glucose-6-phosphate isomerase [Bacteroidales bacterium]|nr:glucose-6-phosphate isomerase [Bacteroidales bacterium]
MNALKINTNRLLPFLNGFDNQQLAAEAEEARRKLIAGTGAGNDFLGWLDWPEKISHEIVEKITADVVRLTPKIKFFVVIGIGGSYLGARAVIEALQDSFALAGRGSCPVVIYAGHTLSEDYYADLMRLLDSTDYAVAVISKSGTTTEPAVAFRIIKAHMERKYGRKGAAERTIAITDAHRGALRQIALDEGYSMYEIPDDIGGRFSVLTPVGLLPIAMAGFDIEALLAGAREMREVCLNEADPQRNPALLYAMARQTALRKGYPVEMLVNFVPQLVYLAEWWKQLYGESEGKEHRGILPHSATFTTDLHSMGQYIQDGQRLMMETVLSVAKPKNSVAIPFDEKNLDGLNYLQGKTINEINHCAQEGTEMAHNTGGVPVLEIEVPEVSERTLGQLIYFFEFACGVSAYMNGVNPFNQPGVEAYKSNMFRLLGKPGV